MVGDSAKTLIEDPDIVEEPLEEGKPQPVKSKRGAIQVHDRQEKDSARVVFDQAKPVPAPINVYNELVRSIDGKTSNRVWWTIDGESLPTGRKEIVKINPRTEEERTIGYEYTMKYSPEIKKKILAMANGRTHFYHKDEESTVTVRPEDW